jgi:hypothetical protein
MSIALLLDLNKECRRLAIAGSDLAVGDFKLQKLLPQLQKIGEKSAIFARVAGQLADLIKADSNQSAEKLLSIATLLQAILATQGETGISGELEDIEVLGITEATDISYRTFQPIVEALTRTGGGRESIVRDALELGHLKDLRLLPLIVAGLDDPYGDLADLLAEKVMPLFGPNALPILQKQFNRQGKKGDARRLSGIAQILKEKGRALYGDALENGSLEVKIGAIAILQSLPDTEDLLIPLLQDRKKEIREAAARALTQIQSPFIVQKLQDLVAHIGNETIKEGILKTIKVLSKTFSPAKKKR